MKPTILLERQHQDLRQLCEAVERGSDSVRESLLPQLGGDLVAHMAVEAQLFYPAIARLMGDERWLRESHVRHARARQALDRAFEAAASGDEFARAIAELRICLEGHVEHDEGTLFPRVDRELDAATMRDLAHKVLALYHVKVEIGYPRARPLLCATAGGGHAVVAPRA